MPSQYQKSKMVGKDVRNIKNPISHLAGRLEEKEQEQNFIYLAYVDS